MRTSGREDLWVRTSHGPSLCGRETYSASSAMMVTAISFYYQTFFLLRISTRSEFPAVQTMKEELYNKWDMNNVYCQTRQAAGRYRSVPSGKTRQTARWWRADEERGREWISQRRNRGEEGQREREVLTAVQRGRMRTSRCEDLSTRGPRACFARA